MLKIVAFPEVELLLAEMKKEPEPPEGMDDDARMLFHARELEDNWELSPRERLAAVQTYSKLKKTVPSGGSIPRGFAPNCGRFWLTKGLTFICHKKVFVKSGLMRHISWVGSEEWLKRRGEHGLAPLARNSISSLNPNICIDFRFVRLTR